MSVFQNLANTFAGWFNESNEYIETVNLFRVTMGDAADGALEFAENVSTAMGIDISQLPFGRDCLQTEGKTYLVFIRNTEQPENCLKLWEHIKSWEAEK